MDSLTTFIVDLLRRGKDNDALSKGGPTVGTTQLPRVPRTIEPKHDGRAYDDIVTSMETGR